MDVELNRVSELGWHVPLAAADGVRYTASSASEVLSYPDEGLEVLGLEGGAGYWFDHRAACVARVLAKLRITSMWEIGSGTGAMASRLSPPLTDVVTVEPLAEGARAAARLGLPAVCGTLQDLRLPDDSVACVGAFDVIEHIADVANFLDEVHRVLQPGGVAVVTVPAFPMLWGDEDDVAGHQRRYTKTSLISQFQASGFTALHNEYLYSSLVAPAAFARALPYRLGKRRSEAQVLASLRSQLEVSPSIDRIARKVLATESKIARHLALPFGLSVLGAFRAA
jgi:SAM-dependent methyltransferase